VYGAVTGIKDFLVSMKKLVKDWRKAGKNPAKVDEFEEKVMKLKALVR
jgi:hypothetical protein